MDTKQTLADEYNVLSRTSRLRFTSVPTHITENLNQKFSLRPYQNEALFRYLDYYDSTQPSGQPLQLLFNMATGSGKTLIMAALILDFYAKGYSNFIFFVDKTNIVEKTKDNFLNLGSSKYLYNDKISIDGRPITINEVESFEGVNDQDINIVFTTTAGLHSRLNNPTENSVTYEDLAQEKMVLISDEAHHINAETKSSHTKTEQEIIKSWEYTVRTLVDGHPDNVLLEFTATIDMSHPAIFAKYKDRIIYQYDLKAFRQDGFSKDVLIYDVDAEPMNRALQAMVISQYRKKVALSNGINLKPVILFKSRTINDSEEFYAAFNNKVNNLAKADIEQFVGHSEGILRKSLDYFNNQGISIEGVVAELKNDFHIERTLIVNSNTIEPATQLLLNRLEEPENELRAIFAVDMLNEGWDVLNLFDIVRLYDTRDAKSGKPGNTTIAEAQLIGRGARYYPFGDDDERYIRKYDQDIDNELRVIEQLHYHSAHNPKYIQEISQALRETGIMPEESQELELVMKPEFKNTRLWRNGYVWVNKKVRNDNSDILSLDDKGISALHSVELPTGHSREINPFLESTNGTNDAPTKRTVKTIKISEFGLPIIRKAIDRDIFFTFSNLHTHFGQLDSMTEFITSEQYLGGVRVELAADSEDLESLSVGSMLYILEKVLSSIKNFVSEEDVRWIGTDEFEPLPINQTIKERVKLKIAVSDSSDREYGRSTYQSERYKVDLHNIDWYVFSDNFGTSEEKSLVKTLESLMHELETKWDDIHLIRNEKFVKIYAFDDGAAFEPDYILFANDKKKGDVSWQVFIEPKGSQFLGDSRTFEDGKEAWKQRFLMQIKDRFKTATLMEDENYRVIGLPFYNEQHTKGMFIDNLLSLTSS
jgi:type III restriction enzyme